jgi:hypothetical protein
VSAIAGMRTPTAPPGSVPPTSREARELYRQGESLANIAKRYGIGEDAVAEPCVKAGLTYDHSMAGPATATARGRSSNYRP